MLEEIFSIELARAANNTTRATRWERLVVFVLGRRVRTVRGGLVFTTIEWRHKTYFHSAEQIK